MISKPLETKDCVKYIVSIQHTYVSITKAAEDNHTIIWEKRNECSLHSIDELQKTKYLAYFVINFKS